MDAIIGFLGSKLGAFSLVAIIPLVFMLGKKYLPRLAGKQVADGIKQGFGKIDAMEDKIESKLLKDIALAVVKWAEYKIPDKGQGRARFEIAANKLCSMLPFLKGRDKDIADIIESAVEAMDNELKKTYHNVVL